MKTVPKVRLSEASLLISQEIGPVQVAELGRHDAVHEPREIDDLGGVLDPDPEAGPAEEQRPAIAAEGETGIEDEERDEHQRRVRSADERRDLRERLEVQPDEDADDRERHQDRDDRLRLAQPLAEREPLDGVVERGLVDGPDGLRRDAILRDRIARGTRVARVQARTDLHRPQNLPARDRRAPSDDGPAHRGRSPGVPHGRVAPGASGGSGRCRGPAGCPSRSGSRGGRGTWPGR